MNKSPATAHNNQWLFLRGLAHEAGHWGEFIKDFEGSVEGAKVHCLDLPGAGEFCEELCPLSVKGMVEFLRVKAHERGLLGAAEGATEATTEQAKPMNILAVSLGGMVALEWAARFPQEVGRVVLINSSIGSFSPIGKRMRLEVMPRFFYSAVVKAGKAREQAIIDIISNRKDVHENMAENWLALIDEQPISAKNASRQLLAAARYRKPSSRVKQPMLVLAGLGDRLVHPSCSKELARQHSQASYAEHPWGGHDLTLDDSHWVAAQVSRWVE